MNDVTVPQGVTVIDIDTFEGMIPPGQDLVVFDGSGDSDDVYILYGFDEVGMFDSEFTMPLYGFSK